MPRIQTYESQVRTPGAIDTPRIEAPSSVTRGLYDVAEGVSKLGRGIYDAVENSETSDIMARMSELQTNHAAALQEGLRTAEPGDKTFAEKLNTKFEEEAQKIGDLATTAGAKATFARSYGSLKSHFYQKTFEGQAHLAALKASQDAFVFTGNLESATRNDPSAMSLNLSQLDTYLNDRVVNGALDRESAMKLGTSARLKIAESSIKGYMDFDPTNTKKRLERGEWDNYLDGDAKDQLLKRAESAIKAEESDKLHKESEAKRIKKERAELASDEWLKKVFEGQGNARAILNDSRLDAFGEGSKLQLIRIMDERNKGGVSADVGTVNTLFERIHLPDGDSRKIYDQEELNQYYGKGLDKENLMWLRQEVSGLKTEEGKRRQEAIKGVMEEARNKLVSKGAMGFPDPEGVRQLNAFRLRFNEEYKKGKEKGLSDTELLSPNSKNYLGNLLPEYTRSIQEKIQSMTAGFKAQPKPGAEPRKPNESAAEYLKRIGKE